jgi:anthranilate phosphoribosyltransferase
VTLDLINKLKSKNNLSQSEAKNFIDSVLQGEIKKNILTDFLRLLNAKGFCAKELTGFAEAMREVSNKVYYDGDIVDNCGTGGDGLKTFNISTTASLIASSSGVCVAKHGNKAITSNSGSADILESSGINIKLTPQQVSVCLEKLNFGFMFAPLHHSSMKYVAESRREIAPQKTIFNLLGPLTNPARAKKQLIGVYSESLMEIVAETLINLGTERAMVIHSYDGMDEISIYDKTHVIEINNSEIKRYDIDPSDYFSCSSSMSSIIVNDANQSLAMMMSVLKNEDTAARMISLINAATLVYISGKSESISDGIEICKNALETNSAYDKLNQLIELTNSFKEC